MIKVENLTKNYNSLHALKGINFEIQPGQIVGLLGPNGAGKTTIMKIITGFLLPTAGRASVSEIDVVKNPTKIQQMIGYLPESTPLYPELSVYESLEFAAQIHGLSGEKLEHAISKTIKLCGLKEKLYYDISELSKGYKQRVGLASALIHDPDILILDEPTTGLDPNQILEIRKLIIDLGKNKTIILSTHIMQEVEAVCNRVIMIKQGEIVADDSIKELKHEQLTGFSTKIVVRGPQEKVKIIFEQIDGVLHVQSKSTSEKDTTAFVIDSEDDISSQLNKEIITAGYDILEISSSEKSMEDIFHKLTK